MRTINITFTVSERQYEYLKLAKCEQPNAQRIKMDLLRAAASNLRREGEEVMREAQAARPATMQEIEDRQKARAAKPAIKWKNTKGTELLLRKSKAKAKLNHSDRSAQHMTGAEWMDDDNINKLKD